MQVIKTALLSYGMSGKVFHAPFLSQHDGFELVGSWERSKQKIIADYSIAKSFSSLEELLASDVDLVIVNTPVETHFEYAKKSLLAAKHVVVEKAFTTSVREATELNEIAIAQNKVLSIFHNRRWDSDFLTVKNILDNNLVGQIVDAEIHFDRFRPNLSQKLHKETNNPGAGILLDLGSHIIDQALELFGFPTALSASIRITRNESIVNDWFDITLLYPNNSVRLKASYFVKEQLPTYIINGKLGSFIKNRGDIQEEELKMGNLPCRAIWGSESEHDYGILHTEINGKTVRKQVKSIHGNYGEYYNQLHSAIINNTMVPVAATDGIAVMKVIEAAQQSSDLKKQIIF